MNPRQLGKMFGMVQELHQAVFGEPSTELVDLQSSIDTIDGDELLERLTNMETELSMLVDLLTPSSDLETKEVSHLTIDATTENTKDEVVIEDKKPKGKTK